LEHAVLKGARTRRRSTDASIWRVETRVALPSDLMATKKVRKRVAKKAKPKAKSGRLAATTKKVARAKKAVKKAVPRRLKKAAPAKKRKAGARVATRSIGAQKKKRAVKPARKVAPKALGKAARKPAVAAPRRKKSRIAKPATRRRYDRPGHLDPKYAAELRAQSGVEEKDPRAFLDGPRSPTDDLAEERGEEVVEKATTGEDAGEESLDQRVPEEDGGPFVETSGAQEFAEGADASNPKGAFREPFPTT
jgi:hypothetical protein